MGAGSRLVGVVVVAATAALAGMVDSTVAAPAAGAEPAVFGVPMPLDPAPAAVPSAEQIVSLLTGIADPHVAAADKSNLVQGGLGPIERSVMDGRMRKGLDNGKLPLTSITAANIQADGPGAATADVTACSPVLNPHTVNIRFVDDDGWKLAHSSLTMLSKMSSN